MAPMPTRQGHFKKIAIDYMGELLESEGDNLILVVSDQCTKVVHHILAKTIWTAADVADFYINDIWRLCCLPRHITSDRGTQFALKSLKS